MENVKNKFSENNFSFGKEFFKNAKEMKKMFENNFGLEKIKKNETRNKRKIEESLSIFDDDA